MRQWLVVVFTLLFLTANVNALTLQKKFNTKKNGITKELIKSGVDNARELLSDSRVELYPELIKPVRQPKERPKSGNGQYNGYSSLFHPESIQAGKEVLTQHFYLLDEVELKYGVPKEILVALFRVETNFGGNTGRYFVFNSLLTWIVGGPIKRAQWAMLEMCSFLRICRDYSLDPFDFPGSTHGAFGLLQFIPSSFLLFAVDADGDGYPDLFNPKDAFHSSGNYLSRWNWTDPTGAKKAVYAYNHDWSYVRAVIGYAKEIKKWMLSKNFVKPEPEVIVTEPVIPVVCYEDTEGNTVYTNEPEDYFNWKLRRVEEASHEEIEKAETH